MTWGLTCPLTYKLFKLSLSWLERFCGRWGGRDVLGTRGTRGTAQLGQFPPEKDWDVETQIDAKYAKYGDMWWHVVTCQDIAQHAYNSCGSTFPVEDLGTSSADVSGSVLTDLIQSKCSRSLLHSSPFFHTFHLIFRFVCPKYHETAFPIFLSWGTRSEGTEFQREWAETSARNERCQTETKDAKV